jgi:hypothetical protein
LGFHRAPPYLSVGQSGAADAQPLNYRQNQITSGGRWEAVLQPGGVRTQANTNDESSAIGLPTHTIQPNMGKVNRDWVKTILGMNIPQVSDHTGSFLGEPAGRFAPTR